MADSYCELFKPCDNLDGQLLINRTFHGLALAREEGAIPLGAISMSNVVLRPYVRIRFLQRWVIKDACYAPVRSVMGLAPGETITTDLRQVDQYDYTNLVQNAMESSEVNTRTRTRGREVVDNTVLGNTVDFGHLLVGAWGSIFGDIWDGVKDLAGAAVDGVGGVAGAITDFVGDAVGGILGGVGGGGIPVATDTLTTIDETLETIQRTQSHRTLTETTTSRSSLTERAISRSFSNPYRDRSMELRFIPVFRNFDVITTLFRFDYGITVDVGRINFPKSGIGERFGDFIQKRVTDPRIISVANAELGIDDELQTGVRSGAVSNHLNANSELYTKRFLSHTQDKRDFYTLHTPVEAIIKKSHKKADDAVALIRALDWSNSYTEDKGIFVPMAKPETALKSLKLPKNLDAKFRERLELLKPPKLNVFTSTRKVKLFMGTHIEAVPGQCVLPNVATTDSGNAEEA